MKGLLVVAGIVVAQIASAQVSTPALPISVTVLVLPAVGDPDKVTPVNVRAPIPISATSPLCNQPLIAASPSPVLVNPILLQFLDPFHVDKWCTVPVPLGLKDAAGLRIVAYFSGTLGNSARSLVAVPLFTISGPAAVPIPPAGMVVRP